VSHFTKVKTQILNDSKSLKKAVDNLGFQLVEKGKCRGYSGVQTCDYVVALPGEFDLSFNIQSNGKLEMVGDFWQGHISKYLGDDAKKLTQEFNKVRITRDARRKGYSVQSKKLDSGVEKLFIFIP